MRMEEIQQTDQKSLDKHVETVGSKNTVNLSASDLSNEFSNSESNKVSINMENSSNNSEVVRKSPLCIEGENMMPSGKAPSPPHDQPETQKSGELVKSSSETPLSAEVSVNVEGIPIESGDLSESECAPVEELDSEKGSAVCSVSERINETLGKDETGDTDLNKEFREEALESDVCNVDNAEHKVTGAPDGIRNKFQKEPSEDGYSLKDSIHSFPKSVVSGSEGETAAASTILGTDVASLPNVAEGERTVIQNDVKNVSELEDNETNGENKQMDQEESVVSDNHVSVSATIAASNREQTDESIMSTIAETPKETEIGNTEGVVRDSVISFERNIQSETNNKPNKMKCLDPMKGNTENTSEVLKSGLEVIELDENSSINDNDNSIEDISKSRIVSQASDLTCTGTHENEVPEKDPLSDTNKDDEEMSEEIDLEVEKNSEKESRSEANNEEGEMLSGETEMDIQSCSEKESHSNLDKEEEILLDGKSEIDFSKSSQNESGEIASQDNRNNMGEETQADFENESEGKDMRGENVAEEVEGEKKEQELEEKEELEKKEELKEKEDEQLEEKEEDELEEKEEDKLEKEEEELEGKEEDELEKEEEELEGKEEDELEKEEEEDELEKEEEEDELEKEEEELEGKEEEELEGKEEDELEGKEEEELEGKEEEELEGKEEEELEGKEEEELEGKEEEELEGKEEEELEGKEGEGLEDTNEKSIEKATEEVSVGNELEKDSAENSCDVQENVEFVQIDSDDKDENSQQSMDITTNESTNVRENDPIAISNEEPKRDDIIVEEEADDPAVEVDASEVEKDDESNTDKTADSADEPEGVDISLMCETVLEETNSTIIQTTNESGISRARNRKSLVAGDDIAEIIDVEVIDDEKEKQRKGSSKNNSVEGGKGKSKANAVSNLSTSANDDEEICIIPDAVPKVVTGKEAKGKTDALKAKRISKSSEAIDKLVAEKLSEVVKDAPEPSRRAPGRPQRQAAKRAESQIKEIAAIDEAIQETEDRIGGFRVCDGCFKVRSWVTSFKFQENGTEKAKYFCSQDCASNFKKISRARSSDADTNSVAGEPLKRFTRKCAQCSSVISGDEKNLSWETMDYCNEECLGRYQKVLGSQCANCKGTVASASLGKYCVRFGYDVKQFCCSGCLEEFKKGLKNCSYCQKDISGGTEGFLAPVGDKGQFKDFCTQLCMEKYDQMSNNHAPPVVVQVCAVCNNEKVVSMEVMHKNRVNKFCSEPCFAAFRFVNGMMADQCYMCKKYFDKKEVESFSVYSDDVVHSFCSKTCMNVYILGNRKIVACHWCKVKKYNFDMIKRVFNSGQLLLVCSLNCLSLYQSGVNTASMKRVICDTCGGLNPQQYSLNMSDSSVRNFCSYPCVMKFQEKFTNKVIVDSTPFPTGGPKRYIGPRRSLPMQQNEAQRENVPKTTGPVALPVISSVQSLASDDVSAQNNKGITTRSSAALKQVNNNIPQNATQSSKVVRQVIIRPPVPKPMRNKAVTCRPSTHTKGTHCRPIVSLKGTQTESIQEGKPILIPVPVPIYVPTPMCMYSTSFPVPVPFPLPVPVPIFIPTTRNSAKGIMKEIKRIQEKIPADPFEAELLMMAEIVAGQKKEENFDSDSDVADNADAASETGADAEEGAKDANYTPENVDNSNTFGDDMLQMALLKMATELEEPADLEASLTPTTITTQPAASAEPTHSESEDDPEPVQPAPEPRPQRGKKRAVRSQRTSTASSSASTASNKRRRVSVSGETPHLPPPEPAQPSSAVEQEKPDANMCLKYTLGVNAWKRWVITKNAELEKAAANNRKLKLFKTEILQQTADELNYSLCLFVKEVRKPNGHEYAPDTIYYLCLGIQQYLFESGRIDNIFTDPYYEKFTECLDEVAKKFSSLYNDSQYIVTRVEEEHLWESKQLGAHSPHVLLSTLMFFNTKHFNLITVEEHMQLSFSHIMKHWKRNPNQSGGGKSSTNSSRNVLLRFYPPQSALDANSKKKKVYEQQENEENPLRCPVKLYEFYLSKCPESVKTRNDVFYLQPERSCVPDSPVWYSTMALGKEPLMKMLHRVKMVKEINQAILKS